MLRPTSITVDITAIRENYRSISEYVAPAKVMPILKANAYGHGLLETARALSAEGASMFGVAFLEEAVFLREHGITLPILALGGVAGRQIQDFVRFNVDITASSVEKVERANAAAAAQRAKARIHLKIDTGMERIGTHWYSVEKLFDAAAKATHCSVVGIFSHCARAEDEDSGYTQEQIRRFEESLVLAKDKGLLREGVQVHMANSGAICSLRASHFDLVRPGLLLYGYAPRLEWQGLMPLRPALSLKSEVVFFKVVRAGAGVSYDHTWQAPEQTRVVTVPIGYGDGYLRAFSNRAEVLIRGERYPVVGRVCMDQLLVHIGQGSAYNGDEVVLLGTQAGQRIDLHQLAAWANTDPREVLCALNTRVPREYRE